MSISPETITALSTALQTLGSTPGALSLLGTHLSQANEMQALEVLDQMEANPATAASLLPELTTIANIPPTVTNWVNQAITGGPANFSSNIAQAKNALLQAATSSSTLGGIFAGL
jgi:hypothetical protein